MRARTFRTVFAVCAGALLVVLSLAMPGLALEYLVKPDGTGDYPTIQAALDDVNSGDVVNLDDGTFTGAGNRDLVITGKDLTLRSLHGDPAACSIDAEGTLAEQHRCLTIRFTDSETIRVEGIRFTGGWISNGAGILVEELIYASGYVDIVDCEISGNRGAGLSSQSWSTLTVSDCRVSENVGRGFMLRNSSYPPTAIVDCVIADNTSDGVLLAMQGDIVGEYELTRCEIVRNGAGSFGHGILMENEDYLHVEDCLVDGNRGWGFFGEAWITNVLLDVDGGSFSGNERGGVSLVESYSSARIDGCRIEGNEDAGIRVCTGAEVTDSQVRFNGAEGVLMVECEEPKNSDAVPKWGPNSVVSGCDVSFNATAGIRILADDNNTQIVSNLIAGNGEQGFAVAAAAVGTNHPVQIDDNTIADNAGAGVEYRAAGSASISRNILADNGSNDFVDPAGPNDLALTCNDVFGNTAGDWTGALAGLEGVDGNFGADPLFLSAADTLYELTAASPCLPGNHPDGAACGLIGALGASDDTEAPVITDVQAEDFIAETACAVTVTVTDDVAVAAVSLHYRAGSSATWTQAAMTGGGAGLYAARIPSAAVGETGVAYYVTAVDHSGNGSSDPSGAPVVWYTGVVALTDHPVFDLKARRYEMLGMSCGAYTPHPALVFEQLGPYGPTNWRYGVWNPDLGDGGGYEEFEDAPEAVPGQGFWLISNRAREILCDGGSGLTNGNFVIRVSHGWNQIANPFAFPVAWADVDRGGAVNDFLYGWNGEDYDQVSHTVLEPWRGYVVWCEGASGELRIPPQPTTLKAAVGPVEDRLTGDGDWEIRVQATAGDRRDLGTRFGMAAAATDGRDPFEPRDPPPPPTDYFSTRLVARAGGSLMADLRAPAAGGVWTLEAVSDLKGEEFTIVCQRSGAWPQDWRLLAVDPVTLAAHDLTASPELRGTVDTTTFARRWRILAGTTDYVVQAMERVQDEWERTATRLAFLATGRNPAPVATGTSFALLVPRAGVLTVDLFDLRGRRVRTLHSEPVGPGRRELAWDGRDGAGRRAAAGVYFIRARWDREEIIRKVTLVH